MNLIPTTPARALATQIEAASQELARHVASQLTRIFELANTPGEQQAIMDVFGSNAVSALTAYTSFHEALGAALPGHSAPDPDLTVFQPQPDGTVVFVAPPAPEPEA